MTELYVEWAPRVEMRRGRMISARQLPYVLSKPDPGYVSVYQFDKAAAFEIGSDRSSSGFARFAVHSHQLFLDLDDGENGVPEIREKLRDADISYELFESGGKGFHFEVHLIPMAGQHVPYSQEVFVTEHFPMVQDLSIYRHNSLIALPGRVHPKTARRKALVEKSEGNCALQIPIREAARPSVFAELEAEFTDAMALEFALEKVANLLRFPPEHGRRTFRLWSAAESLAVAGYAPDTVFSLLLPVAFQLGKDETTVTGCVNDAFKKICRR